MILADEAMLLMSSTATNDGHDQVVVAIGSVQSSTLRQGSIELARGYRRAARPLALPYAVAIGLAVSPAAPPTLSTCCRIRAGRRSPNWLKCRSMSGTSACQAAASTRINSTQVLRRDLQPAQVQVAVARAADRSASRRASHLALDALAHPLEHAAVLAVAGPEPLALGRLAEPVHVEDARRLSPSRSPISSQCPK